MSNDIHERADEYVLGLLDSAEVAAIEAEMETDTALRAAVAASRDRFLEIDLAGDVLAVSPGLWGRIEAALGAARPAMASRPEVASNDNRLPFWRRTAVSAIAASLLLAAGLGYTLTSRPEPVVIAVLMNDSGEPLVLIEDFGNASAKVTPLVDYDVPAGRAMQVWTLPSKDMGPQSMGLLDGWHSAVLHTTALPAPGEEQLYEITLEQPGGSPTGRPTGPVLVKGFAKAPR